MIGTLLGQITGLVMAIAMFFLCYLTIINIHRVAEIGADHDKRDDLDGRSQDRIAAIMMFRCPPASRSAKRA